MFEDTPEHAFIIVGIIAGVIALTLVCVLGLVTALFWLGHSPPELGLIGLSLPA